MAHASYKLTRQEVVRLWLSQQALLDCTQPHKLTATRFQRFLNRVGALQVDTVNVLDRAHYLTLWSQVWSF